MGHSYRVLVLMAVSTFVFAASKPHVVAFGKPTPAKIFLGAAEEQSLTINVRPLYVDAKLKEFTTGTPHEVTDRLFVVRRAFRINDSLPDDAAKPARWLWQRGGWLLVDRSTGHVSPIKLPEFDPLYSDVTWFRDYAAYCGVSDSADRLNALVAQIGTHKAIYRKELGKAAGGDLPDSECEPPQWQRQPTRVTFLPKHADKFTVNIATRQVNEPPPDTDP